MNFHQFTNTDGEVLIVRRIPQDRTTRNGFIWPSGVGTVVECPDWNPKPVCGGGLHGWPWGFGIGDGCDYDIIGDIWLVLGAKPEDVVGEIDCGAKCKIRRCVIRLEGAFGAAITAVQSGFDACVAAMAKEGGDSSTAASSGRYSTCEASGKNTVAAIAGTGRIRVGLRGAFAVAYYTDADGWRFLTGKVGEDGIEADVWYVVRDGKLCKE